MVVARAIPVAASAIAVRIFDTRLRTSVADFFEHFLPRLARASLITSNRFVVPVGV